MSKQIMPFRRILCCKKGTATIKKVTISHIQYSLEKDSGAMKNDSIESKRKAKVT
jgi:hypothetical protein